MRLRGILARNLRRYRHALGLSQEELAGLAGLNRNYVGMLEREENAATVDVLERLAEVLEVRAEDLLSVDAPPSAAAASGRAS